MKSHLVSEIPHADIPKSVVIECMTEMENRYQQYFDMTFTCVDSIEMSELNGQYRSKYHPTNVLSFHYETHGDTLVGEVFFCPEVIHAQAQSDQVPLKNHYVHLIFHSLLHILGHTHQVDENRKIMEQEEITLLKQFGIQSPYEKLN
jgi:probable rRNA maturation factor